MRLPYFSAKAKDTGRTVQGFYFEYPETTWCFTEDYEKEPPCKLIPCIVTYRMTDWSLPNVPQLYEIDISTLEKIGEVEIGQEGYKPMKYIIRD